MTERGVLPLILGIGRLCAVLAFLLPNAAGAEDPYRDIFDRFEQRIENERRHDEEFWRGVRESDRELRLNQRLEDQQRENQRRMDDLERQIRELELQRRY